VNQNGTVPLAGVLRVVYFLSLASVLVAFTISTVGNVYQGPSEEEESVPESLRGLVIDQEREDYNRNLGVIYSLLGTGIMGAAIVALRREMNGLRVGGLFGGTIIFLTGLGYAGSGSADWLISVWSFLALAVLAASGRYMDEGATVGAIMARLQAPPPPGPPASMP